MITVLAAALLAALLCPRPRLRRLQVIPQHADSVVSRRYPRWQRGIVTAGVISGGFLLLPFPAGAAAGVVLGCMAWWWLGKLAPRADTAEELAQLPDALDFLAISLHSGATQEAAVEIVGGISPAATASLLHQVGAHWKVGCTPEEAWASLREHPVWGVPARDLQRSARSGTGLVELLHAHAEDARAAQRDTALKRARGAGVKAAMPLMLCFLPAFILVGVVPIIGALIVDFL